MDNNYNNYLDTAEVPITGDKLSKYKIGNFVKGGDTLSKASQKSKLASKINHLKAMIKKN